jgi:FkbH-like protein
MPAMRSAPFKNVRLVIWDLDETFWHGTLTEGGIRYNTEHHDIVVELCRRGIMNSICSRNERTAVEEILVGTEIWEYFIFPSIDWSPKADRIAEIVEAVQLRAETVVFVDDHPANLAQAKAALSGLQIADPGAIRDFLSDPGFAGKSDPDLTRLRQYKLLETRHVEMGKAGGNTAEFLRQSNIAVTIIYDVEKHLDRAIELINRTNQLNFTKQRLSEDKTEARAQLLEQIAPFHARAGLVAVCDRYGDYGICGFFLVIGLVAWAKPKLEHFAFSCRTLGMGVEQWVYELLGQPELEIVGEVLSDLNETVDWINIATAENEATGAGTRQFGEVRIRGGCELEVIEHFFRAHAQSILSEVVTMHGRLYMPRQNSTILAQALQGLTAQETDLIGRLGMDGSFYDTRLFEPCADGTVIIYSPTGDRMPTISTPCRLTT